MVSKQAVVTQVQQMLASHWLELLVQIGIQYTQHLIATVQAGAQYTQHPTAIAAIGTVLTQ